ncbi:MAG: HAD family hydrolase [Nocardioidaceae bacterium]
MLARAVVFDVSGVLEITPDLGIAGQWEARLGLAPGEIDQRLADVWTAGAVGTVTESEVHRALGDRLALSLEEVDEFMAELWREYLGTPNTELIDYASTLHSRYRTGILSNSFVGAREREQVVYGLADLVDVVVYSHEVGMAKPDPRIYALTCQRLGVKPAETVFLDDAEGHVTAAREAGINAIHYRDTPQAIADIEATLTVR